MACLRTLTALLAMLLASCASQPPAQPQFSVPDRVGQFQQAVAARVAPDFLRAGIAYPPYEVAYLAFKNRSLLEVYARNSGDAPWTFVRSYPVLMASGGLGPKLKEGDRQVPEGIYQVDWLNPNSISHLSLHLNFPNAFDEIVAQRDGRVDLGSNIMIHGGSKSIGCLAMGDEAAEDLFVISALVKFPVIQVLISPVDFRAGGEWAAPADLSWGGELYGRLRSELKQFGKP